MKINFQKVVKIMLLAMISQSAIAQQLTDYEAIQNLIVGERLYRVSHRNDELAKCYTADAQIHTSWQKGGVSSFVGQAPKEAQTVVLPNVNRCNPPLIHFSEVSENKALVEYPSTTTRGVMVNGVEAVLTSYMRLIYRVEKRYGEWKISAMTSINEYDELAPAIPGQNLKIKPKEVESLRTSYRWLAYTRIKAGGTVDANELGTDRPEELNKFYADEYKWLNDKDFMETKNFTLTIGDYKIAVSEVGSGPDMVVLHGRNYSHEMMQGIVNQYKDRYHVVTFDALGHGESSHPEVITLEAQSDVLLGVIEQLKLQKPVVIGFSMGSYITLLTAERRPDLLSRIVLMGTRGLSETGGTNKIFAPQTTREQIVAFDRSVSSPVKLTNEERERIGLSLKQFDLITDAPKATMPALVLTGHYDGLNTPEEGRRVANALPNATFHEIPDAGHIAFFENPSKVFELIDEFLR